MIEGGELGHPARPLSSADPKLCASIPGARAVVDRATHLTAAGFLHR